jgi:hypothetical protein
VGGLLTPTILLVLPKARNYRRGGGLKRINSCRKVLLQIIFKTKRFYIVLYESYHSMDFYGIMAEIKDDIQIQHRFCP